MVEDPTLPFPESVAASEIHKAGQQGAQGAKYLFWNMGFGGLVYMLSALGFFASDKNFFARVGAVSGSKLKLGASATSQAVGVGGITTYSGPTVAPSFIGVGYIIGPELASLNFSGSVLAWGLLIPLLIYFMGPQLQAFLPPGAEQELAWGGMAAAVWRFIVRPIAVGGMLFGSIYTLFRMRNALLGGLARAFKEFRTGVNLQDVSRTERYMSSKVVLTGIFLVFLCMIAVYTY